MDVKAELGLILSSVDANFTRESVPPMLRLARKTRTHECFQQRWILHLGLGNRGPGLGIDLSIAETLRNHVHDNISWAWQYRAAVDDLINTNAISCEPTFISFAEANRVNNGDVHRQEVYAPEIAAILYTSGEQDVTKRTVLTYPKNSPDSQPRFPPLRSPAYESLQCPLLCMHGEARWSPGHRFEDPPIDGMSRTISIAGNAHVTLPFYCRQRIISERVFQRNSRIAQERITDSLSRIEVNKLSFMGSQPFQQR